MGSFEIEYTAGNAHGKVTARVTNGKASPDEAGAAAYSLVTKIEEWMR